MEKKLHGASICSSPPWSWITPVNGWTGVARYGVGLSLMHDGSCSAAVHRLVWGMRGWTYTLGNTTPRYAAMASYNIWAVNWRGLLHLDLCSSRSCFYKFDCALSTGMGAVLQCQWVAKWPPASIHCSQAWQLKRREMPPSLTCRCPAASLLARPNMVFQSYG